MKSNEKGSLKAGQVTRQLLVIDNYDSFTYNLVQYLGELGAELSVHRNDAVTVDEVKEMAPAGIVLSPGPGVPQRAGICVDLIREVARVTPVLGVCLGHQAIGVAFGAPVVRASQLMHGKTSKVHHDGSDPLFEGLPSPFEATRYHSLILEDATLPDCLLPIARTNDGTLMGVRHQEFPVVGVQFHPESVMTPGGLRLLENFLCSLS